MVVLFLIEWVNPAFSWFRRNFCGCNCCLKSFQPWLYSAWFSVSSSFFSTPKTQRLQLTAYLVSFLCSSFWSNYLSNGYILFPKLCVVSSSWWKQEGSITEYYIISGKKIDICRRNSCFWNLPGDILQVIRELGGYLF